MSVESLSAQSHPNIMTWGENVSPWSQKLGLVALREGCSIVPTSCEPYLDNLAMKEGVKTYYVSMPFDVSTSVSWAKQYSSLSLSHPMMAEIGFDDFVNKIENDQIDGSLPDPASFVSQVIAATKSANPNLAFGVTIYEDSLTHKVLTDAVLPAALRAKIEYVHLYVHYRQDASTYATAVAQAKTIFPGAKIIAGAYSYDRIDYLPCAFKGTVSCTVTQEQSLYTQLLQIQTNLLKQGSIYGLEFFFGYFGNPEDWPSWQTQARVCDSARILQCYANTKDLQAISQQVLHAAFPPVASISQTSLNMGSQLVGKQGGPSKLVMTNSGSGPLSITSIDVAGVNSTNFPLSHNCPSILAPAANCALTISFAPTATGARSGEIIVDDDAGSGAQTVMLTGTGTTSGSGAPAVSLPHTSLYMGSEFVNKLSTPAKLVMTNSGSGSLSIASITVVGVNSTDFPLSHNCPATLGAGLNCTLTIYFKPAATGTRSGQITIKDNAGTGSQTVTLTGTGLATGTPAVSLPHTSLYMGSEFVNKLSTPAKLVMTNSGSGSLSIASITVVGVNSTDFPLSHNCPATLGAGLNCTLTIYFKPAATGTRSGQITIKDNAGTGSQTVTLTGTGLP
jgi:hypothetical protein